MYSVQELLSDGSNLDYTQEKKLLFLLYLRIHRLNNFQFERKQMRIFFFNPSGQVARHPSYRAQNTVHYTIYTTKRLINCRFNNGII